MLLCFPKGKTSLGNSDRASSCPTLGSGAQWGSAPETAGEGKCEAGGPWTYPWLNVTDQAPLTLLGFPA